MPETKNGLEIIQLADQTAWERWLERNHERDEGVWVKFAKKASPVRTVTMGEAVEAALCFGWIDGQSAGYDEHFVLGRFTPRRRRSKWSEVNRTKATALIAAGRMRPSGMAAIEAAKADGRWQDAYPPQSKAKPPPDFARALRDHPDAGAFFEQLRSQQRYAFLHRLHHVKDPQRRAKRIADYVELLSARKTLN